MHYYYYNAEPSNRPSKSPSWQATDSCWPPGCAFPVPCSHISSQSVLSNAYHRPSNQENHTRNTDILSKLITIRRGPHQTPSRMGHRSRGTLSPHTTGLSSCEAAGRNLTEMGTAYVDALRSAHRCFPGAMMKREEEKGVCKWCAQDEGKCVCVCFAFQ